MTLVFSIVILLWQIIEVNWSPAFEGPLSVPPTDVLPYYNAYILLAKMFSSSDKLLQFRLLPGQLITFNNRRILHGRNSFSSKGGVRHLQVHILLMIIHIIIMCCRVPTSTLMSTTADFMSSMKYLVLDKLNEFSIILHCKVFYFCTHSNILFIIRWL